MLVRLLLGLSLLLSMPVAADAATVLDGPVAPAAGTAKAACQDAYRPGAPGIATREIRLPLGPSRLTVALGGAAGDWDVAVFDTAGKVLAASAELGATESAMGYTLTGGAVRVQACRRTGNAATVPVSLSSDPVVGDADAIRANPPQLVSVATPTKAAKDRLLALGLDMTEHGGHSSLGVVLHGLRDRVKLRRAGFEFDVLVRDLVAQGIQQRRAEYRTLRARQARAALPSGRTGTYRRLADYNAEMKQLAADNPGLVRTFVMPHKTLLGKEVMGIEIADNVGRNDGRPAFFNMGVHHAREWPAGEMPMEWAYELVNGFKNGDPRATRIVTGSRNIVVPIVNPDGFEASREAGELAFGGGGRDPSVPDTLYIVSGALSGGEYRRKNCRIPGTDQANCLTSPGLYENGTDPNRNYGGLWGGPGADTNPFSQSFRGDAPFSEPESRNVQDAVSRNQVMTLITNHTTAALVLRAPGLAALGDPVDEHKGYKALGDAMAKENGYFSQKSFELYDTTGTTEDWSYNATGGFGFTFEIYCGAPNYQTGDCDAPAFHPTYAIGVENEWTGDNDTANHVNDPAGAYDGKGNREAYYIAAESTLNEERHSVLTGEAPAGAKLRLTKSFKTATFPQADGEPILFDDRLETVYDVRDDGRFEWHVNPSTRPIVAKQTGRAPEGPPSPAVPIAGTAGADPRPCPDLLGVLPPDPACSVDHPFTFQVGGGVDNEAAEVAITFGPQDDWDLEVFEDVNGNGVSDDGTDKLVGSSGEGVSSGVLGEETVTVPRPAQTTKYVARVTNFAAAGAYEGAVTFTPPLPLTEAAKETWTLTCEVGGKVLQTTQVGIERGERKTPDLSACISKAPDAPGGGNGGGGDGPGGSCLPNPGFKRVAARGAGRAGVRLRFPQTGAATGKVDVKVYRVSEGRRAVKPRVFARFDKQGGGALRWNGRSTKGAVKAAAPRGWYFARFRVRTADGVDTRRVALQRTAGGFKQRKPFYRRDTCGAVRQFKLGRPVFDARGLKISYLLGQKADARLVVRRGGKVVRRFTQQGAPAGEFQRRRLKAARRGVYRVTLRAGGVRATLFSRRL